ncbi:MAG: ribonuclease III [Bacteroidetes bacterium]|nr:ribonuclease III [Bacteroidota bacterium]
MSTPAADGSSISLLGKLRKRIEYYRELGAKRRVRRGVEPPGITPRRSDQVYVAPPPEVAGVARGNLSGADFEELERRIGHVIKYRLYFMQALTHRSYLQFVQQPDMQSNERLEFLGDAVLDLVIGEYLYREFQNLPEGELTKLRSRLVSGTALAKHANDIGLEKFILLSTSARHSLDRGSQTLLADAYEAIIAAIYLDGGMDAARDFIYRQIITHTRRDELMLSDTNYKSMLLEFAQSQKLGVPRYVTVGEEGPNHARVFSVEVLVGGMVRGAGRGHSKKEAEQEAALRALEEFGVLTPGTTDQTPMV